MKVDVKYISITRTDVVGAAWARPNMEEILSIVRLAAYRLHTGHNRYRYHTQTLLSILYFGLLSSYGRDKA